MHDVTVGKGRIRLFHVEQIDVTIMPVRMPMIVPASRMLELGFELAEPYRVERDLEILALSSPGLLAAKFEAFEDRSRINRRVE